jgi:hypothetical protein
MNFRVGQPVICIDASPGCYPLRLVKGERYTIKSKTPEGGVHLLEEAHGNPLGFNPCRFRPAVERKTDISVFTAMLTPQKSKERV